jgi:hypothetical protein
MLKTLRSLLHIVAQIIHWEVPSKFSEKVTILIYIQIPSSDDRLCGLVVRVPACFLLADKHTHKKQQQINKEKHKWKHAECDHVRKKAKQPAKQIP